MGCPSFAILPRSLFRCFFPLFLLLGGMSHAASKTSNSCTWEDLSLLLDRDLRHATVKELGILEEAAEGGTAKAYLLNDRVVAIKSVFFGETGKAEINYYFDEMHGDRTYAVEIKDFHYTMPIYFPTSKTAAVSIKQFTVCEGQLADYPAAAEWRPSYERAEKILVDLKKYLHTLDRHPTY